MRKLLPPPKYILIACQPKSASTFLTTALGNLPSCRTVSLVPGYDRREQEICEARLKRYRYRRYKAVIAQHHIRYSQPTARLINKYNISTVVLIRDFFDSIVSLRDHVRNESPVNSMGYLDETHGRLPDDELEGAIARIFIPWYINFYMSWREAKDVHFVNYDELIANPVETTKRVVDFSSLQFQGDAIQEALNLSKGRKARLNKGITGRGKHLSKQTKQYVVDLLDIYPNSHSDQFIAGMLEVEL